MSYLYRPTSNIVFELTFLKETFQNRAGSVQFRKSIQVSANLVYK